MARPRTARPYKTDPQLAHLEPRDKLIYCGRVLFQQKGFEGVNIREILQAADVTQPTIYYYFQSKDGLFLAALLDLLEEIDEDLNRAAREKTFNNQLKGLAKAFNRQPRANLAQLFSDLNQRVQLNSKIPTEGISMQEARPAFLYVNQLWPRAVEMMLREAHRAREALVTNPSFMAHYLLTVLSAYPHSPFSGLTSTHPDQSVDTLLEYIKASLKSSFSAAQI